MGLFGLVEEPFADRQATLFNGAVEVEQRFAQPVDLRQLGHFRAAPQGRQLFEQSIEFLALRRVLAPATQQVFGIEQNIHAFSEEDADQLRVAGFAWHVLALAFRVLEALVVKLTHSLEVILDTRQWLQRVAFQLCKALAEQRLRLDQYFRFAQLQRQQVGFEFLDHLFQWRGNLCHWQDTGHVGAALEGVQRALQVIGYRLWQLAGAVVEKRRQGVEVGVCLVAKNLQQLGIQPLMRIDHWRGSLDVARGLGYRSSRGVMLWEALPFRQGVRIGSQTIDIVALTLGLGGKFIDQLGHQGDDLTDHLLHVGTWLNAAVEHAVEQVFDRPGQLTDHQRTHHATAALEGVEGATHFNQRILVLSIGAPARQEFGDGFQHLAGFFDKDFAQIFINRLFIGRRRQQAGRHIQRRRVDRLHRSGHHVSHGKRFLGSRFFNQRRLRHSGQIDLRQVRQVDFIPLHIAFGVERLRIKQQLVGRQFQGWQLIGWRLDSPQVEVAFQLLGRPQRVFGSLRLFCVGQLCGGGGLFIKIERPAVIGQRRLLLCRRQRLEFTEIERLGRGKRIIIQDQRLENIGLLGEQVTVIQRPAVIGHRRVRIGIGVIKHPLIEAAGF